MAVLSDKTNKCTTEKVQSDIDRKIQTTQKVATQLDDLENNTVLLDDIIHGLKDGSMSKREIIHTLTIARDCNAAIGNECKNTMWELAPVGGLGVAKRKLEAAERRRSSTKSSAKKDTSTTLKRSREVANEHTVSMLGSRELPKRRKSLAGRVSVEKGNFSTPWHPPKCVPRPSGMTSDGKPQYTPREVVEIFNLEVFPKGSNLRGEMQKFLLDHKLVPVTTTSGIQKLVSKYKDSPHNAPAYWN